MVKAALRRHGAGGAHTHTQVDTSRPGHSHSLCPGNLSTEIETLALFCILYWLSDVTFRVSAWETKTATHDAAVVSLTFWESDFVSSTSRGQKVPAVWALGLLSFLYLRLLSGRAMPIANYSTSLRKLVIYGRMSPAERGWPVQQHQYDKQSETHTSSVGWMDGAAIGGVVVGVVVVVVLSVSRPIPRV
ncbi:hypothetical protein IWX50DRAFT_623349 [Phyllosticta citricarpa]|uniref:Uncharacterized protein n=1 Tax=Phyllosticta citricarpa TaxID=55181 RepID=A0ABR1MND7_9PEZI